MQLTWQWRTGVRQIFYAAGVAPVGLVSLGTAIPSPERTAQRWSRLTTRALTQSPDELRRPSRWWLLGHALASFLIGLAALILAAVIGLMVARGALYGLVDDGPYDDSWGGPTLAGAWLAHAAISIPIAAGAAVIMVLIGWLHQRMTLHLYREPTPWWVPPSVLVLCGFMTLFVVGWINQL